MVDMLAGVIVAIDPSGGSTRHPVGKVAAALRARESGGFVLALENGFAFADDDLAVTEVLAAVFDDPAIRFNDGGCDPLGRFLCGTMAYDETPGAGSLYRLATDHNVSTVFGDVTISNGLQWSADGSRAFYNDTPTGRIDVFDVDSASGDLVNRRPFVTLDSDAGWPDGMAIDADDGVWIALWGGSSVRRYASDGTLSQVVELPVSHVTACTFGGTDRRTLYVTTSQQSLEPGAEPRAGSVFAYASPVAGAVPHRYAG